MTTYAADDTTARVRDAWALYHDSTAPLDGASYAEAERHAWDQLQEELRDIERDRRAQEPPVS
jgi:hypothetical protein